MRAFLFFSCALFVLSTGLLAFRLAVVEYPRKIVLHRWTDVVVLLGRCAILAWIVWLLCAGGAS